MMLAEALDPHGATGRRAYWLYLAAGSLALLALGLAGELGLAPDWLLVAIGIALALVGLLLTVRRLRDAALSPWWALLMLLTLEPATVRFGELGPFSIGFGLFAAIPVLLCLFVPGRRDPASV